jgi:8-amino-7-oxononanoate synthase
MLDRMQADLASLRVKDQFRELATPEGIQLCSNDYLGLSTHPELKSAIARALEEEPRASSTGSRLISGNSSRWEALETRFAEFLGVEAALYFSSGYAANVGLLSSILKSGDTVFSDSANHASLIDGIRLSHARKVVFPHLDLGYLDDALRRCTDSGEKIIVVESIFSMDGDRAPLPEIIDLCRQYGAWLIVDEAHSTGVDGARGRGAVSVAGRSECVLATVHPCGKALAAMGGFVAGSRILREFLINTARTFIFSTALPPYCAGHVQEGLNLAAEAHTERQRLKQLGDYMRQRMRAAGYETGKSDSQIIPFVVGSNEAAVRFASALAMAGFAVRAIRPPTVPAGTSRLRLSLNANLSFADIDRFVEAMLAVGPALMM